VKATTLQSAWKFFSVIRATVPRVQVDTTLEYIQECLFDAYDHVLLQFRLNHHTKVGGWGRLVTPFIARVQMDNVTEQGEISQSSAKESNTIITRDQEQSKTAHEGVVVPMEKFTSSEPMHEFKSVTDRWMPLDSVTIETSMQVGDVAKALYLPEALYSSASCSPNLIPFETFIYGRVGLELRIVVNANKFHCGKLVVSSKYNSYQADEIQAGYQAALTRNHIIIDLTANNEGVLQIPFRYYRPFLRLVKNDNHSVGVRPSKYCSVYLQILSPLSTGPGGASSIQARVFYRLTNTSFTGMSYRVKVQMLGIEDIISNKTNKALKEILVGAERAFDQLGSTNNQDKPGVSNATIIVPKPRLNFATGKGVVDVNALRVNPNTLTNYKYVPLPNDEPTNYYQLARIWGLAKELTWNATDAENTSLMNWRIDPHLRAYDKDYIGEPTPLEYAISNFQFWSGPIELRFDFVSNSFHTGTVQISAEFGRVTTAENLCESSSTYVKVFHLGEQKTVSFRVPYIYDTLMRRSTTSIFNPYGKATTSTGIKSRNITVSPDSNTYVKVRVINALKPVASAPQSIKILVFMRAGKNFSMHSLKSCSMLPYEGVGTYDNFPNEYTPSESREKRDAGTVSPLKHKQDPKILPEPVRNEWNEYRADKLPKVQMDTGDKETLDETENFAEGLANLNVQTLDCHMDFKDLLRRPTLLLHKVKLIPSSGDLQPYFIPLTPPVRNMCKSVEGAPQGDIFPGLFQTTAVNITSLFRCWRGGMRYTIVVWSGTKPIMVSLIPHSGVRILGYMPIAKKDENTEVDFTKWPIYGSNFISEIIVPTVNPTAVIEAPYDTENIWTLMNEADPARNYSWRDKGDYNSGHLAITVEEPTVISVFWSAADDFTMSSFYGIPKCFENGWAYRWNDQHAKVQMDFLPEETSTMVRSFKSLITPKNVARMAISSVPVLGTGWMAATVANEISPKIANTCDKLAQLAESTNTSILNIQAMVAQAIEKVVGTTSKFVSYATVLYNVLLDVLIAWMEKSWRVVGVGILRFVTSVMQIEMSATLLQWAELISTSISEWVLQSVARVQAPSEESTLCGILVGLVGSICGVTMDPRRTRSVPTSLLERFTSASGMSYLMNTLRFVQGIFEYLKTLILEALGYISPEAHALRMLSEHSDKISTFVREAQIVTSEACGSMMNHPQFRLRSWKTVLQAYQFQRLLCTVPSNVCNAQLARLCSEVIKIGNEKFTDLSASPVRYEPYVVCIEGGEGVGKSSMSESLIIDLLKSVGFSCPSTSSIYFRTAGEKFWSGYREQPVIVYDEFLNTNDPQRCMDMVVELQKLKSTALFIPEMAHLEEKKIRGNPLIVVILCNGAFPNLEDYARYPRAVLRRRDVVLRVERTPEYVGKDLHAECTPEELESMPHLRFRLYKDSKDSRSLVEGWRSYADTKRYLITKFSRYHEKELKVVKMRMDRALAHLNSGDVSEVRLQDPMTLFYQLNAHIRNDTTLSQNAYTPFEELEEAVLLLSQHIEQAVPVEEERPLVEDISWGELPRVQMMTSLAVGGLLGLGIWKYLCRATSSQLTQWCDEVVENRAAVGRCAICMEDTPCLYVCQETLESEAQHLVCALCYNTSMLHGRTSCALCRCPNMVPRVTPRDLEHVSLIVRTGIKTGRSISWVCQKLAIFFEVFDNNPYETYVTTLVLSMLAMSINPVAAVQFQMASVGWFYVRSLGSLVRTLYVSLTQGDDWDDDEESPQSSQAEVDAFEPELNEGAYERLMSTWSANTVCLHKRLNMINCAVRIEGDSWIVPDLQTNLVIKIPLAPCHCERVENCIARTPTYKQFIEHYIAVNKRQIRSQILQYYNQANEVNQLTIHELWRPTWAEVIKVPRVSTTWWEYLSKIWEKYHWLIIASTGITTAIGAMIAIYKFSTRVVSGVQNGSDYDPGASPRHRHAQTGWTRQNQPRRYFQDAGETPTPFEVARKYIVLNTFVFTIAHSASKEMKMYGVGLYNHYVLIPRHYVVEMRKAIHGGKVIWGHPHNKPQLRNKVVLGVGDIIESTQADLALIKLQPSFPMFKDIRKFIATEKDYERGQVPSSGILMSVPTRGSDFMMEIMVDIKGVDSSRIVMDQDDNAFEARDVIVYNYSRPGACGSLLLRENSTRPIIAMHFAGHGEALLGEGYGIILSVESLGSVVQQSLPTQREDVTLDSLMEATMVFEDEVRLDYVGTLEKEKVPYIPQRSKIVPSLIKGASGLECESEPTILHKSDPRYKFESTPLYEGSRKHGLLTQDFTSDEIAEVKEMLWDGWYSQLRPLVANPTELTNEQAIIGFDNEYYKGMDLDTSAGYPFVLSDKKQKSDYIELIRDENLQPIGVKSINNEVINVMRSKNALREQGIVPMTLFVDTLKDEKRKRSKLMALGGTRVFCNSSLDYVIECRKKFMHFIAAFTKHRHSLMHALGVNPMSHEWGKLLGKLLQQDSEFVTIDYSNFGPGYNAGVAKAAFDILIDWTMANVPGMNRLVLECIAYECIQSGHVCHNTVYTQVGGSPSGAVFTTVVNSIVNQIYILLAWRSLYLQSGQANINTSIGQTFKKNVAVYVYGDDAILTVNAKYKKMFNGVTISEFFTKYGIVATSANKESGIKEFVPLSEATFLKRGFLRHPYREGEWLSPLSLESIKSTTQWVWKSANLKESTYVNAEAAILQAHGHGEPFFMRFKNDVNAALMRAKCPTVIRTWKEIDNIFYTTGIELNF
jgi:hypothetical protein